MQFLIVLAILVVVALFVTVPLWRRHAAAAPDDGDAAARSAGLDQEIEDLDAAREAKYREIRDAELDHNTGKLSDADFEAVDQALRAEAIEILKRLDRARERRHG